MKLGVMQPYFFPYIGYFQLIHTVDAFVIYDNIKYTKKGWINRNRFLLNGQASTFSIPLKDGSDYAEIKDRQLSGAFNRQKILNQIREAYRKAPYFQPTFHIFERVIGYSDTNLFAFIKNSLIDICTYLAIKTPIIVSSSVAIDHSLKCDEKIVAFCKQLGADTYINPIGGIELYSKERFKLHNINLQFLRSAALEYKQFDNNFVPWLSIIDVMMFNSPQDIALRLLDKYELV